ncbi:MAG: bifunctional demethylmenaquinone methyltransferase/2-methoxy-6-polyprenyl-1,4-benzoquinol methylase UbiE [Planctomycetota bacterium]
MTSVEQQPDNPAWTDDDLSENPHENAEKASRVQKMFSAIAPSYDLNNRVHSMWRDQAWRRTAVKMAELKPGEDVVDVACGTGDLSLAFAKQIDRQIPYDDPMGSVIGIDFTYEMLPIARDKASNQQSGRMTGWPVDMGDCVSFLQGDAMNLPLPDACCDVVSIAFGIRNVAEPSEAMTEFYRVLKPGGRLIVLEFSLPKNPLLLAGYNVYFKHIMPRTATLISGDKSGAYKYLPKSVNTFIDREGMQSMMTDAGFQDLKLKALTFGIAVCYRGVKRG